MLGAAATCEPLEIAGGVERVKLSTELLSQKNKVKKPLELFGARPLFAPWRRLLVATIALRQILRHRDNPHYRQHALSPTTPSKTISAAAGATLGLRPSLGASASPPAGLHMLGEFRAWSTVHLAWGYHMYF